ncbi:unnamed protein product [Brassicogethes aeneus]|uniref:C2H2-type domain-containing protein n=1 Tax=Brassicogethes aeneus TaxID=1431903 RepID=A0A9P0FE09_BRAAE|nr:unnamed protein product [Brassicogethes aeneus]
MEEIVVKIEPVDESKGDISSAELETPSTSGKAIKQEIKEELDDDSFVVYVKEELETPTEVEIEFQVKDEIFLDKGSNDGDEDFSCKIREDDKIGHNFDCVYKCVHCSIQFFNRDLYLRHEKLCLKPKVDKEKFFKCDICLEKYQTRADLFKHKKYEHLKIHDNQNHVEENCVNTSSEIHTCKKCSFSTINKSTYNTHMAVCPKLKKVKWHKCDLCPYRSFIKGSLIRHTKTHSKIKDLKCSFCNYYSNEKISLDNHVLSKHLDCLNDSNRSIITSKVHACQYCNYKTAQISNFKSHLKNNHLF